MSYRVFAFYNVTGAILWVGICVGAGYLFGNIPVVKENFELVVLGIVGVSVLPIVIRSDQELAPDTPDFVRKDAHERTAGLVRHGHEAAHEDPAGSVLSASCWASPST